MKKSILISVFVCLFLGSVGTLSAATKKKPLSLEPIEIDKKINEESNKPIPSSLIFVPASMGLLIASEVVKDITGIKDIKGA